MMFEITGTIKVIFDEQTFGSGFTKREFVLTTEAERFPQDIKFECVKDKIAQLTVLKVGSKAKVTFDLRGREWKGNYYVNLNAWRVEGLDDKPSVAFEDEDGAPIREPDFGTGEVIDDEPPF